jgi:hypothetical protein
MTTVELFCGTKSFSKVAAARGHTTCTLDKDWFFSPDIYEDIRDFRPADWIWDIDVLWASPPCQGFSVAAIGKNWNRDYTPKTDSARVSVELVGETLRVIGEIRPRWFFIENPRAMLRKLPYLSHLRRVTVTYCRYGDTRQKPTDIWTNVPPEIWTPKPPCSPGSPCHEAAPRGARTGTQGLKGAAARGSIPPALFDEIFDSLEKLCNKK